MRLMYLAAGIIGIGAIACDPITHLTGRLMGSKGEPVSGATVRTLCPDQSGAMTAMTDNDGRFATTGLGCIHAACRLEVLTPGLPVMPLSVGRYCTRTVSACGKDCSDLRVELVVPR